MAALTLAGLLIHGYHPYAEDAEIYLPGIKKLLNPGLFPANAEFFDHHAGYSLYPHLIAASARWNHLSIDWLAFCWHVASIFLLLAATFRLASAFFDEARERWCAVALMAALLTLPVAGTALYILDQYLNPRNLAAFAALFGLAEFLHRKYLRATIWLLFCVAVHPLMASFAVAFVLWIAFLDQLRPMRGQVGLYLFPLALFAPASPAYHEVALRQPYFFLLRWEWYEWLGLLGPMVLFWWWGGAQGQGKANNIARVSRGMVPYLVIATIASLVLCIPGRLEPIARFEPLRCLALAYILLIVIGGGLLARRVLHSAAWRWLLLLVPLSLGMFAAQRELFPASQHVEWPWVNIRNPWAQAFLWARDNTPPSALFALNPDHMHLPGEDENGFRARAERSRLADAVKDKGAASAFPPLADHWLEQVRAQQDWKHFRRQDFERLARQYGVSWVIVEQPGVDGLQCPYQNSAVRVCRVD